MASYKGHLAFASTIAVGYGTLGFMQWELDWGDAALGAGLCCVGGVLPDLDSDSSVPMREVFGVAAAVGALLAYARLRHCFNHEQAIVCAALIYMFIRYVVSRAFKHITVHRGMWHSLPAMGCAGVGIYLLQPGADPTPRAFLAGGMMLGFLSHLALDELYAVNLVGVAIRLNKFAGSALKFFSKSWKANVTCYTLLGALGFLAVQEPAIMPAEAPPAIQKPARMRWRNSRPRPFQQPQLPQQSQPQETVGPSRWDQPRTPATNIPGPGR